MQFLNKYSYKDEGCIFQKTSLLKFPVSLHHHHHHHQCNYCYKFKDKFFELKHLLLSKIKADEGKSCYLATFSTKDLNLNLIKHNQNKDIMGTAKNNCCVVARQPLS